MNKDAFSIITRALRASYMAPIFEPDILTREAKVGDMVIAMHVEAQTDGRDVGKLIEVLTEHGRYGGYVVECLDGQTRTWENTGIKVLPGAGTR